MIDYRPTMSEESRMMHWMMHRMSAKGLSGYAESTLLADEWMIHGGPPPEALAAVERGERDLTRWCPELRPELVNRPRVDLTAGTLMPEAIVSQR